MWHCQLKQSRGWQAVVVSFSRPYPMIGINIWEDGWRNSAGYKETSQPTSETYSWQSIQLSYLHPPAGIWTLFQRQWYSDSGQRKPLVWTGCQRGYLWTSWESIVEQTRRTKVQAVTRVGPGARVHPQPSSQTLIPMIGYGRLKLPSKYAFINGMLVFDYRW